jgi:hypothetical protein
MLQKACITEAGGEMTHLKKTKEIAAGQMYDPIERFN